VKNAPLCNLRIATSSGPKYVPAYSVHGEWAVTREVRGGDFAVTHVPTGRRVAMFDRRAAANRLARALGTLKPLPLGKRGVPKKGTPEAHAASALILSFRGRS
jgi:hypothetical protein